MKKTTKKYLSLLLALALTCALLPLAAFAEGAAEEPEFAPDELIVGHPTITKGDFFTEMFGNDTADIVVRALIHGYNLVNWDQNQGVYLFDPSVVTDVQLMEDELGNHTYYMILAEDLTWCDGTPITAWDYAFSLLLLMAPEIEQIGGKVYRCEHILGYRDYMAGEEKTLRGVQVLSDHQLAITLDHDFLPYFFETGLLLCAPYPISEIAPGCKVRTNEYGEVYIGNEDENVTEPVFTAELLKKTILDPETGYNSHPSLTCGPYVLTAYDGVTCHFVRNPYFKGAWYHNSLPGDASGAHFETISYQNRKGETVTFNLVIPTIEKIAFTVADYDTMVEDFAEGKLHLVNKVVYADAIHDMLAHSGTQATDYPRVGLSFLTFTFDWPTVHEKEVRQAIAWCMDRDALTRDYCQEFGFRVDGYYGIEQWEYLLVTHQIDYPINFIGDEIHEPDDWKKFRNVYVKTEDEYKQAVAAWDLLTIETLTQYKVDTKKANALLDAAGWTLNAAGGWRSTVNVPKKSNGQDITYSWLQSAPSGYELVSSVTANTTTTNTYRLIPKTEPTDTDQTVTINYRDTEGNELRPTETRTYKTGDTYTVDAPAIEGYKAVSKPVSGVVGNRNVGYIVTYKTTDSDEETTIIEDYGTPLGLGDVHINVGVSFE